MPIDPKYLALDCKIATAMNGVGNGRTARERERDREREREREREKEREGGVGREHSTDSIVCSLMFLHPQL